MQLARYVEISYVVRYVEKQRWTNLLMMVINLLLDVVIVKLFLLMYYMNTLQIGDEKGVGNMGQWGYYSYEGDDVHDFLDEDTAQGNHASPTTMLNKAWKEADYDQAKLGVVVYILFAQKDGFDNNRSVALHMKGYKIPMSKLKAAKEIAISLLSNMDDWVEEDKRRRALVKELVAIQNEIDERK